MKLTVKANAKINLLLDVTGIKKNGYHSLFTVMQSISLGDMVTVEKVSSYVTKAICMDVTSEEAWKQLPIKDIDIGIVCFGENIAASILTCMILKEAGVKYIISKAGNKLHKEILEKLEIDEVVLPEEYVANLTAEKILNKIED